MLKIREQLSLRYSMQFVYLGETVGEVENEIISKLGRLSLFSTYLEQKLLIFQRSTRLMS